MEKQEEGVEVFPIAPALPVVEDEVPSLDEWSDDTDDPDLFQADE